MSEREDESPLSERLQERLDSMMAVELLEIMTVGKELIPENLFFYNAPDVAKNEEWFEEGNWFEGGEGEFRSELENSLKVAIKIGYIVEDGERIGLSEEAHNMFKLSQAIEALYKAREKGDL